MMRRRLQFCLLLVFSVSFAFGQGHKIERKRPSSSANVKPAPKPKPQPKPKSRPQVVVTSGDYVDLGLPSGTLWATRNVGASKPEEYGDYFAWGETKGYNSGKRDFSWSTYKWCNGSSSSMTKYCDNRSYGNNGFTDNKTELDLEDDAAYVNWGSQWRMPSLDQIRELEAQCTWTWTTYKGTKGYLVKGKNGNSIFLPAAGWRYDTPLSLAGSYGFYWSRSLTTDGSYDAYVLSFDSGRVDWNRSSRYSGRSVRPVRR